MNPPGLEAFTIPANARRIVEYRAGLIRESTEDFSWLARDPVLGFTAPLFGAAPLNQKRAARFLLLSGTLRRVLAVLNQEGIRTIVMKGVLYADQLYPDPSLRPTQDLDLLVEVDRFRAAVHALQANGYQVVSDSPYGASIFCNEYGQIVLPEGFDPHGFLSPGEANLRAPIGIDIDLHWHISPDATLRRGRPMSMSTFWDRPVPVAGYASDLVLQLNPAAELFYMLFNWHRNGFRSYYILFDIELFLAGQSGHESLWAEVYDLAIGHRCRSCVYQALELRHQIQGEDASTPIMHALRPAWLARFRAGWAVRKGDLLQHKERHPNRARWFLQWVCLDRTRDMWRVLLELVFPERGWLRFRYAKAPRLARHWWRMLKTILSRTT